MLNAQLRGLDPFGQRELLLTRKQFRVAHLAKIGVDEIAGKIGFTNADRCGNTVLHTVSAARFGRDLRTCGRHSALILFLGRIRFFPRRDDMRVQFAELDQFVPGQKRRLWALFFEQPIHVVSHLLSNPPTCAEPICRMHRN